MPVFCDAKNEIMINNLAKLFPALNQHISFFILTGKQTILFGEEMYTENKLKVALIWLQ